MGLLKQVKDMLAEVEHHTKISMVWAAAMMTSGKIQINVYPVNADAQFRTFDTSNGWTPKLETDIYSWFGGIIVQE